MLLSQSRPSHLRPVLQVSQCACSRTAFHPKGLCITDRGSHPEMSRGTVLEQGSWLWVAMGVRMSTWMQSYLPPPPSSCVSPSLSSPGFLWHHSIKGATTCCQPVATKIDEKTSLWGKVFSRRKVLPVLSLFCPPPPPKPHFWSCCLPVSWYLL